MMPQLRSTLLLALCTAVAPAQDKLNLGPVPGADAIVYQFQLRAVRAGSGLDPVVASRNGGGAGFAAVFGDTPLRLRLRLDGDGFPGRDGMGPVSTSASAPRASCSFPNWAASPPSCPQAAHSSTGRWPRRTGSRPVRGMPTESPAGSSWACGWDGGRRCPWARWWARPSTTGRLRTPTWP